MHDYNARKSVLVDCTFSRRNPSTNHSMSRLIGVENPLGLSRIIALFFSIPFSLFATVTNIKLQLL